jgi:predicted phosphodiesterase
MLLARGPGGALPPRTMRILATADLHYNHAKSRRLADALIERMNRIEADLLLLIGDTAAGDGDWIEQCLARFRFDGPKLFVAGNHELWTARDDSYRLFKDELPRRVREMGWKWLEGEAYVEGDVAIVGSVGWYDYSFAQEELGIPQRFYEAKVSPGAADLLDRHRHLLEPADDVPPHAREVVARWNDGQFVKLHRKDEQFLDELMEALHGQLEVLSGVRSVVAAIHHLPFGQLLPPRRLAQWDFAKAYLGAAKMGELLLHYPNVGLVLCGHSHFPAEAQVGHIAAINIGSGYNAKQCLLIELASDRTAVERIPGSPPEHPPRAV